MKILLISDSHGNGQAIDKLARMYPKMDLYLHAGDSQADEWSILPFSSVKGNCDYYPDFPMHMKLPIPGGFLWMQHYPQVDISMLKENNVKLFIYGHTHRRDYKKVDDILFVNPGSISYPRDDYYLSYAIITIDEKGIDVQFKQL